MTFVRDLERDLTIEDENWNSPLGHLVLLFNRTSLHLSDDFHDLWWSRQFGYEELYLGALDDDDMLPSIPSCAQKKRRSIEIWTTL